MGNSVGTYERSDHHRLASLEKELPFLTVTQNPRKKRNFIFHSGAWKRIVESTRKRGSKMKINPSQSCPDSGTHQDVFVNGEKPRLHSRSGKMENGVVEKSLSCYVINTKEMPPTSFVTTSSNSGVVTHFQQPPSREDADHSVSYKSMNGHVTDKQIEAFAAKPSYARLNNNNIEKTKTNQLPNDRKIPTYDEAVKQEAAVAQRQRTVQPAKSNPSNGAPKKVVIQASTSELLRCLGEYVSAKCKYVPSLEPSDVISWLRGVDRSLLMQGWQDISFIMPSSVVFVYMLCRDVLNESMTTVFEVQATMLTCLYMSYSYMGNEISYPLRPFLIESDRHAFWARCCKIMNKCSGKMLRINKDSQYFTSVFRELKAHGTVTPVAHEAPVRQSAPRHVHHSRSQMHNSIYTQNPHFGRSSDGIKISMTAGGY